MMLWAAATMAFFSFCRSGEVTVEKEDSYDPDCHLSFNDLGVHNPYNPSIVSLLIKQSKTDQERRGVEVYIGKSGNDLCPVAVLLAHLSRREDKPGPFFQWENGLPLTKSKFLTFVRTAQEKAGLLAKDFAGHSFRIGAATTATMSGLEDSTIQTLGRWKSTAFKLYVKLNPHHLASLAPTIAVC